MPPRASQIEGKGGHHFDDRTLGTPTKSKCKVCVSALGGHFLGLVLMTSLSGGSVGVRVGFSISLGGGPWEAVGVCDHPAGAVWFRGPGQFRAPGSIMSGGLLGVVFHVAPIALSALCPQAERGNVAALTESLNATRCAEGRCGSVSKDLRSTCEPDAGPWVLRPESVRGVTCSFSSCGRAASVPVRHGKSGAVGR